MIVLLSLAALANGQSSHLWITETAVPLVPAGELRDLLDDPDAHVWLRNGAMFPDGGYAVGQASFPPRTPSPLPGLGTGRGPRGTRRTLHRGAP